MTFQRVLDGARLTKAELAHLYGISRQTIYIWSAGGAPRANSYTARMATTITRALCASIDKGLLPFSGGLDKGRRQQRVHQMALTLQNLKPAPIE